MNNKIKLIVGATVGIVLMGVFFIYLKNDNVSTEADNRINLAASFYPIYFLTSRIGGDLVNVTNLTPAGVEPHDYEITAKDIIKIKKSKLLFLNGGGLEVWSEDIQKNIDSVGPQIITLGDGIIRQKDPHIWLSPIIAIKLAEKISDNLIKVDPKNKNYYESNLGTLKSELTDLDAKYKQGLANCSKKDIITTHTAFGYLTEAYGLNQIAIAGLSPEEEPSSSQLAQVAKFAKEQNVRYIFFESLISPKLAQTIAQEVGAETLVLNPIEGLDDEELSQGKNYLTEMEVNLGNLKKALECK